MDPRLRGNDKSEVATVDLVYTLVTIAPKKPRISGTGTGVASLTTYEENRAPVPDKDQA